MHMSMTQLDMGRERPRDAGLLEDDALHQTDAIESQVLPQSLPGADRRLAVGDLVLRGAEGAD